MRDSIHFHLGAEPRTLRDPDPTMTVLEYLRGPERLCGTKEGCAEGDCGACTVILAHHRNGHPVWDAVNACILFLPALDGKQLLTVEHLANGATLHPVQQAMVDHHASQCGFCTPGFVMSLAALRTEGAATRAEINEALAGNLCRCTGYRPIIDAALDTCATPEPPTAPPRQSKPTLTITHTARKSFAPRSAGELAETYLAHPEATLIAGATDVGLWVTKLHQHLPVTITLDAVADLATVTETPDTIRIGATATYQDALPLLEHHFPDFGALIRRIGSRQIRNRGTIAGNIANASPIGDTPPALLALDATITLRKGPARRTIKLTDFFTAYRRTVLQPSEFIEHITIPKPSPNTEFRAYKISKRFDQDIAAVCAAFTLHLQAGTVADIRLAFGGMAATPIRSRTVEDTIRHRPWTEPTIRAAQSALDAALTPLSDTRASAAYRRTVARNLLHKFFLETTKQAALTRLIPA